MPRNNPNALSTVTAIAPRSPIAPDGCETIAGVDGCPAGWLWVAYDLEAKKAPRKQKTCADAKPQLDSLCPQRLRVGIEPSFARLLNETLPDCLIMVDMPVGLVETGRRACEGMARTILGPRRSSVFSAPRRPMLHCETYAEANALGKAQGPDGGGGLSAQAWNLIPKIRDLDAAITPKDQARLGEAHTEVAFTRLGAARSAKENAGDDGDGAPCRYSKRSAEGEEERRQRLTQNGLSPTALIDQLRLHFPLKKHFSNDDLLDACALLLTAKARIEGDAWRFSNNERDERGLMIEIWG